jgi:hypothetical protein
MTRERYCKIKATSLEEILVTCNRHIKNINLTLLDLIDNQDGTDTDIFYIDMFRGTWADLRDDVEAMLSDGAPATIALPRRRAPRKKQGS